jgi:hypothetical protein
MTDVMMNLFIDVHLSEAILTVFVDGNCFQNESTISVYSLRQILLRVRGDSSKHSHLNALYDCCNLGLIQCSRRSKLEQVQKWGSHSKVLDKIWQFQSSSLPVCSVLSLNEVMIAHT